LKENGPVKLPSASNFTMEHEFGDRARPATHSKPKPAATSVSNGPAEKNASGPTTKSSRFFPAGARSSELATTAVPKSNSPPPPEESSLGTGELTEHPLPRVKLPSAKPLVKLPPARTNSSDDVAATCDPSPSSTTQQSGIDDISARIKGLFADRHAAGTRPATVNSSSRTPIDQARQKTNVSLPAGPKRVAAFSKDTSEVTQPKPTDDELFEQPEFGSTPVVRLAAVPHNAAHESPVPTWRHQDPVAPDVQIKGAAPIDGDDASTIAIRLGPDAVRKYVPARRARGRRGPHSHHNPRADRSVSSSGNHANTPSPRNNSDGRQHRGGRGYRGGRGVPRGNNGGSGRASQTPTESAPVSDSIW